MKKIRDFRCQGCSYTFERWVGDTKKTVMCKCGAIADRVLSAPKVIGNTTGKSPSFSNRK